MIHSFCLATCEHTHTHTRIDTEAHTDPQLLFRWRLDIAYLSPAAVCVNSVWKRGSHCRHIFTSVSSLQQQTFHYVNVTHSQWAWHRHNLRTHTFHMSLLLSSGDSYSFLTWEDFLVPLHFQSRSGWLEIKAYIKIAGDTFPPKYGYRNTTWADSYVCLLLTSKLVLRL